MPIYSSPLGWILETTHTAYALGVTKAGVVTHRYWGARLPFPEDYPVVAEPEGWVSFNAPSHLTAEEYPAYAGVKYGDPCLKATFADGVRDTVLRFERAEVRDGDAVLDIHLIDAYYPLHVTLHYRVHETYDLIERSVTVRNDGKDAITLERVFSAQWHLPAGGDYHLTHVNGRWADEFRLNREPLTPGLKIRESRRITTSHHANPWFMADRGTADEDQGEVWFGTLAWSGNWKLSAEKTDFRETRLSLGVNDWDFAWRLAADQAFTTPISYGGYTPNGVGAASRTLHRFIRDRVLPHGQTIHKILYNSWEATTFNVDVESQGKLAQLAAHMGVELFVMDDGWFHGRKDDHAGLGDWWPDAEKFPNGLKPLIDQVTALGMDFGLWVEPEMVNPDSDLYRAHPDWVIHFPDTRTHRSAQSVDPQFCASRCAGVHPRKAGSPAQRERDHVHQVGYESQRERTRLAGRARRSARTVGALCGRGLPGVGNAPRTSPGCGLAKLFGRRRTRGYGHFAAGRSDMGERQYRSHRAAVDSGGVLVCLPGEYNGSMGYRCGCRSHTARISDARQHVRITRHRRQSDPLDEKGSGACRPLDHVLQRYSFDHPVWGFVPFALATANAFSAVQYVSADQSEGVLFAFRTHISEPIQLPPLYLRGLQPDAQYEIEGISGVRSGAAWMHAGLTLRLGNFQSTVRRIWQR